MRRVRVNFVRLHLGIRQRGESLVVGQPLVDALLRAERRRNLGEGTVELARGGNVLLRLGFQKFNDS